nr:Nst1p protein [Hymenolepis microstoma]
MIHKLILLKLGRYLSSPNVSKAVQDFSDNDSINNFLVGLENNSSNRWNQSSPRHLWLAKKKADRRKVAQKLAKLKIEEEAKRKQEEEELMKKKCISREKIRTWFKGKKLEMMKQKELAEIAQTEENLEAANKRVQQFKAQEKYREWLQVKQHAKITEKQRRETEHRSRELADREKRKRAEETFQAWLSANKTTLARRQTPYTKCISGGVIIKYFDRMAAPEPGFVNKNNWVT